MFNIRNTMLVVMKKVLNSSTLSGLRTLSLVLHSIGHAYCYSHLTLSGFRSLAFLHPRGCTCCYSCSTLSGFGNKNMNKTTMKRLKLTITRFIKENTCMTIPEGLNMNNIRQLPDEQRMSPSKRTKH